MEYSVQQDVSEPILRSQRAWLFIVWVSVSDLQRRKHKVVTEDYVENEEVPVLTETWTSVFLVLGRLSVAIGGSVNGVIAGQGKDPEDQEVVKDQKDPLNNPFQNLLISHPSVLKLNAEDFFGLTDGFDIVDIPK